MICVQDGRTTQRYPYSKLIGFKCEACKFDRFYEAVSPETATSMIQLMRSHGIESREDYNQAPLEIRMVFIIAGCDVIK